MARAIPHHHNKHVAIDDLGVCTKAITLTRVKWCGLVADKQEPVQRQIDQALSEGRLVTARGLAFKR
ncbi:hypothetical protein [Pantoea vagans]|uniref:hypothetical protein n=1 Tax=Pantoea vagans TaxID=470934 RepID=UPI003209751A